MTGNRPCIEVGYLAKACRAELLGAAVGLVEALTDAPLASLGQRADRPLTQQSAHQAHVGLRAPGAMPKHGVVLDQVLGLHTCPITGV